MKSLTHWQNRCSFFILNVSIIACTRACTFIKYDLKKSWCSINGYTIIIKLPRSTPVSYQVGTYTFLVRLHLSNLWAQHLRGPDSVLGTSISSYSLAIDSPLLFSLSSLSKHITRPISASTSSTFVNKSLFSSSILEICLWPAGHNSFSRMFPRQLPRQ